MGDQMDEAKANVKYSVAKRTGDREVEAEGKTEHDAAVIRRLLKTAVNKVKGAFERGARQDQPGR
jgi:uncharacterized protein YjbJ (UPF0337 family)